MGQILNFRFYIGCERCTDWFHGHCVGILQVEADNIDEYLCPRCDPISAMNKPNSKPLQPKDYELVKKIVKQLMVSLIFEECFILFAKRSSKITLAID